MTTTTASSPLGRVLERDRLTAEDLLAVAQGESLALRIDAFYDEETCRELSERLKAAQGIWTSYSEESGASDIKTAGPALFDCFNQVGQELCRAYWEEGFKMHRKLRSVLHPATLPVDRVQLELDHVWPEGAGLLHIERRAAFYGLVRMFTKGGAAHPHTDRADWDFPSDET